MKFYIIIPAHNEEAYIAKTLQSLTAQTLLPKRVVVVNDNSTDSTEAVIDSFTKAFSFISKLNITSSAQHLPGSKIVNAFYKGYNTLDDDFDVICKFDADLIFPKNYLEQLAFHFNSNPKLGMASGHCYIENNNTWIYENIANKSHTRGPIKAYSKNCFKTIGGLKKSIGWDTVDELLAQYNGYETLTDNTLKIKHLKPTGSTYNKTAQYKQGEALYKMRYGILLTKLTALKMAYNKSNILIFKDYLIGFFNAYRNKTPFIVTKDEVKYIRHLRWKGVCNKLRL